MRKHNKRFASGLTSRILNFTINLHRSAVVSECEALDRRAEGPVRRR